LLLRVGADLVADMSGGGWDLNELRRAGMRLVAAGRAISINCTSHLASRVLPTAGRSASRTAPRPPRVDCLGVQRLLRGQLREWDRHAVQVCRTPDNRQARCNAERRRLVPSAETRRYLMIRRCALYRARFLQHSPGLSALMALSSPGRPRTDCPTPCLERLDRNLPDVERPVAGRGSAV